jgi:hypothetical protein
MGTVQDIYLKELAIIKSRNKWVLIAAVCVVVLTIIILITVFKKRSASSDADAQLIRQMDSTLRYQQKHIETLEAGQAARDSIVISELSRISGSKQTQTRIIHEYEKIPSTVNDYDREQLRRAITDY